MEKMNLEMRTLKVLSITDKLRSKASNKYELTNKIADRARKLLVSEISKSTKFHDKAPVRALLEISKKIGIAKISPNRPYDNIELNFKNSKT